jgi:hypothetical protein
VGATGSAAGASPGTQPLGPAGTAAELAIPIAAPQQRLLGAYLYDEGHNAGDTELEAPEGSHIAHNCLAAARQLSRDRVGGYRWFARWRGGRSRRVAMQRHLAGATAAARAAPA